MTTQRRDHYLQGDAGGAGDDLERLAIADIQAVCVGEGADSGGMGNYVKQIAIVDS